jgi:YesN/AraC family two-component response regulator
MYIKPSKNLTILVVEDNSDLRLYLNSVLEEKYNVLLAENGKVGLYKARTEMPDFILTDVTMPVMDGITMIREIKQDRTISHIPIIILSAKASVEDQLKGFEQGVDGYLTKPFSTSYLMGRIEAAINKRKATQTDIAKMMKQNGKVGYAGKTENSGNSGNAEAAEIFQPATEPRKTLSELNFELQEKERLAEEKKSELKSYAFMESQINDKTMGRILKYVTDNMGSPDLKIDDIADAIGMSRSVLYNKIKQAVGMTPIDFVRHIRIMRACELLQQTNDPLTSIAFEVGFSDPKYFSKVFKKELGIVPSEYRERTKE